MEKIWNKTFGFDSYSGVYARLNGSLMIELKSNFFITEF